MDKATGKSSIEEDRHLNVATSASAQSRKGMKKKWRRSTVTNDHVSTMREQQLQ